MKFIIESSRVPIYNRIAIAFKNALENIGHTVYFIDASSFKTDDFISIINKIDFDFYLSTNELNFIQAYDAESCTFLFENIDNKIIFVHHDNLFSCIHSIEIIDLKLKALNRHSGHTFHFCIEKSNVELLKSFGIYNSFQISHASEFKKHLDLTNNYQWSTSFVGHLMSGLDLYPAQDLSAGLHLKALAWNRFSNSQFHIQPELDKLINTDSIRLNINSESKYSGSVFKQFLMAEINKMSSAIRGEYIRSVKHHRIDIFGGDLSYGKINDPLLKISQNNIYYNSHTIDYSTTSKIYNNSKINLNFTALQFDTAINNRCFDIICSGGFLLTDCLLPIEESLNKSLYFSCHEELIEKINFFNDPKNSNLYHEIKNEVHNNISQCHRYEDIISTILINAT